METRETLEAAILEHPKDDAPRLAYANWLEKQGDCGRAEFIRLQIAEQDCYRRADAVPSNQYKQRRELGRQGFEYNQRAYPLLKKHVFDWIPGDWCGDPDSNSYADVLHSGDFFKRGILEGYKGDCATFLKEEGDDRTALVHKAIILMDSSFQRDTRQHQALASSPLTARIQSLTFWPKPDRKEDRNFAMDGMVAQLIAHSPPKLKELTFAQAGLKTSSAQQLVKSALWKNLESFDMSVAYGHRLPDDVFVTLFAEPMPHLRKLSLAGCGFDNVDWPKIIALSKRMPELHSLSLISNGVSFSEQLAQIPPENMAALYNALIPPNMLAEMPPLDDLLPQQLPEGYVPKGMTDEGVKLFADALEHGAFPKLTEFEYHFNTFPSPLTKRIDTVLKKHKQEQEQEQSPVNPPQGRIGPQRPDGTRPDSNGKREK